jgi:excisionase family DNA binding protein
MIQELQAIRHVRVKEAAEILGLGKTRVYELMDSGELPSVRIGTARRIPLDGLEAYLAKLRGEAN